MKKCLLLAALCCVATMIIKIPSPLKGYLNLGDCIVLVSGWLLAPGYALAAAGIGDFRQILGWVENNSPLNRNITLEDVGGTGVYLCSDVSSGVTGEIVHVDAGYNLNGMVNIRSAYKSAELLATFKPME